nr:hypothetical protein BdHM001_34790 [Bdellovibrio sp. HM001]
MSSKRSEQELGADVVAYLQKQGFDVYQEVSCGSGYVDIVAVKNGIRWAIETKTSLSDQVIDQALSRLRQFHYVSVAVPAAKGRSYVNLSTSKRFILNYFGIGVLSVSKSSYVFEEIEPKLCRTAVKYGLGSRKELLDPLYGYKAVALLPEQQIDIAGGKSGQQLTSYKLTNIRIVEYLRDNGPTLIKTLAEKVDHHYSSCAAMRTAVTGGVAKGWLVGISIQKGIASINDEGYELLAKYGKPTKAA